jgi:acyl-CoA thioesterase I
VNVEHMAPLRYVALGDSYTIGTSVDPTMCWPVQLVRALAGAGGSTATLELVANLGVNGYTSGDLIRDELPELDRLRPEFASVLIGVNDVVRGISAAIYEANIRATLEALLVRLPANRIVTVAIPDYTVTPHGSDSGNPRQQRQEIAAFNSIMARLSADGGIPYVDTFDLSLRAAEDRSLVAADGLHPSGAQYALWVERIVPVVADLLAGPRVELTDPRA